jgi:hypothetical protein
MLRQSSIGHLQVVVGDASGGTGVPAREHAAARTGKPGSKRFGRTASSGRYPRAHGRMTDRDRHSNDQKQTPRRSWAYERIGPSDSVNLILPMATWLGWSQPPGDVPGSGPLDAKDSRALADLLAAKSHDQMVPDPDRSRWPARRPWLRPHRARPQ